MQQLYALNKSRNKALIGAHVIEVIASMEYGIAARALRALGVDARQMQLAISAELEILA